MFHSTRVWLKWSYFSYETSRFKFLISSSVSSRSREKDWYRRQILFELRVDVAAWYPMNDNKASLMQLPSKLRFVGRLKKSQWEGVWGCQLLNMFWARVNELRVIRRLSQNSLSLSLTQQSTQAHIPKNTHTQVHTYTRTRSYWHTRSVSDPIWCQLLWNKAWKLRVQGAGGRNGRYVVFVKEKLEGEINCH